MCMIKNYFSNIPYGLLMSMTKKKTNNKKPRRKKKNFLPFLAVS